MFKYKLFIERPLISILISLIFGIVIAVIYKENKLFAILILLIYIGVTFITIEQNFFIILCITLIISSINFLLYFSSNYESYKIFNVRIEKNYNNFAFGNINGKNISISGNIAELEEGALYSFNGSFKRDIDLEKGNIGLLNVSKTLSEKKDIWYKINSLKIKIQNRFIKILGNDKAAIVLALSFGNTDLLTEVQKNNLKDLGIIHAISVSGFHIALIYKLVQLALGSFFALLSTLLYVIFTGLKAITLRSFFMILILVLSKKINKNYDGVSSLAFSAIFLLIIKPFYIFDTGFALSYLSTFSILKYNKLIMRKLYFLPQRLNESVSISLSAMILSLPYILIVLKNFSVVFLLGNLFMVPIYTLIVILGNAALIFNMITKIFNCINYVIYIILCCCEGIEYFLMKITPPRMFGEMVHSIMIISLFFALLLFKRGYNQFKYVPVVFCALLLIYNYKFFPTIEYIKYDKNYCFVLRNKDRSILLSNISFKSLREEEEVKRYLDVKEIKDINIVNAKYQFDEIFLVDKVYGEGKKSILYLRENNKNYLLGEQLSQDKNERIYDIINLKFQSNNEKAYIPETITTIVFIFGKPFII